MVSGFVLVVLLVLVVVCSISETLVSGRVYSVTYDGQDSFSTGERFHKDIKVVIHYYAEPKYWL